jgi:hypothetical protein
MEIEGGPVSVVKLVAWIDTSHHHTHHLFIDSVRD